jgi:carbon storage regulator CsrA
MLVVSRDIGEVVVIDVPGHLLKSGEPLLVRVMLTKTHINKAKLGFDAPEEVDIHREEVWDAIQRKKEIRNGRLGP